MFVLHIIKYSGCHATHSIEVYPDRAAAFERRVAIKKLLWQEGIVSVKVIEVVIGQEIPISVKDLR